MGVGPKTQRIVSTVTPVTGVPGQPLVVVSEFNSVALFNGSVSVGITSTTVRAALATRLSLVLVNDSSRIIYVFKGAGAVLNKGIRLNRKGGNTVIADYSGIVTAICDTAGSNLTIVEVEKP